MNLLLDESVPRRLGAFFPDSFYIRTIQHMGWAGVGNGDLLRLASDREFDAFVTVDQGFEHEQNQKNLPISVIIMIAARNRLQELQPLVPEVVDVLFSDLQRQVYRVPA